MKSWERLTGRKRLLRLRRREADGTEPGRTEYGRTGRKPAGLVEDTACGRERV